MSSISVAKHRKSENSVLGFFSESYKNCFGKGMTLCPTKLFWRSAINVISPAASVMEQKESYVI